MVEEMPDDEAGDDEAVASLSRRSSRRI